MLANEKLYEMKVPNNIVLNPKDGSAFNTYFTFSLQFSNLLI
jgi:hypothetical protein